MDFGSHQLKIPGLEYQAIGLFDDDDTNLLNLPDLLFRRMNIASGMYEIRVASRCLSASLLY